MAFLSGLLIFLGVVFIVLCFLSLIKPDIGGFWMKFIKEKKRSNVFWINIAVMIILFIMGNSIKPQDPYESGMKNLDMKNFLEAKNAFEKIGKNNKYYSAKYSLINKVNDEAKKYYSENIEASINNLDYYNAVKYNDGNMLVLGNNLYSNEDIKTKILDNAATIKKQIINYESKNNYQNIKELAEKLLNVEEYKDFAEEILERNKKKIELAEIQKYKNSAINVSYSELLRFPDKYIGKVLYIKGQVFQKTDYTYMVNTKKEEYLGYISDLIMVKYTDEGVIEKDIIGIYGDYEGLETYSTILGSDNTVPKIKAKYISIISGR